MSNALAQLELDAEVVGLGPASRGARRTVARLRRALALLPGAIVLVIAVAGPWLAPHDPGRILAAPYAPPRSGLPLGSDHLGHDVWSQVLCGGRPLIVLPVIATATTSLLGTALGMASAYAGGWFDAVVSRLTGVMLTIPAVVVLLVLLSGWGYHPVVLVIAVAITGVPLVSRIARAGTLRVLHTGYIEQAVALGDGHIAVLAREVAPNVAGPILADAGLRFVAAIYLVAAAAFLGFSSDGPNWGAMLSQNIEGISLSPWGAVVPAALTAVLAVSASLLLDWLARRTAR